MIDLNQHLQGLEDALVELNQKQAELENAIASVKAAIGTTGNTAPNRPSRRVQSGKQQFNSKQYSIPGATPVTGKRQLSAEGRQRIADAQRRRWAAHHAQQGKGKK